MQMENGLSRFWSVVHHHPKVLPLVAKLLSQLLDRFNQLLMHFQRGGDEILIVLTVNGQQVDRRQWRAVVKHDYIIIFIENPCWSLPAEDSTKHAFHGWTKANREATINQNFCCQSAMRLLILRYEP